jgi:hypothetical protein
MLAVPSLLELTVAEKGSFGVYFKVPAQPQGLKASPRCNLYCKLHVVSHPSRFEMSIIPQQHNSNAIPLVGSHNQVYNISGDQYNTTNTTHHHHLSTPSQLEENVLAALKPVDRSVYYVTPCMQGTRQWVFDQIHTWLNDFQAPNILWLGGSPGAGKSTIASTLVSQLAEMGRLGSQFFFKRGDATLSNPAVVWRTIAFDLAQVDSVFAERLMKNIKERKVDLSRADIESHFKYTIADPLTESWKRHTEGEAGHDTTDTEGERPRKRQMQNDGHDNFASQSLVIVLDALDECGSDVSQSVQRRILMDTITRWSRLHPSFKLFITSRDQQITPSFRNVSYHIFLETGDLTSHESNIDIQKYFEQRFAEIASGFPSLPSWPGPSIIKQLTNHAAGLFVWADTVMRYLEEGFPKTRLERILGGAFREPGDAVDQLYQQILQLSFKNAEVLDLYRRVVGAIVLAKMPLHRVDLKHFLGQPEDESCIDFVLKQLSSVISIQNTDGRIYTSHLSFSEFVCDPGRCEPTFVIDVTVHNQIMASACLQVMKSSLRFNICNIETSHIRNDDLDLASRIEKFIPPRLSYACTFWTEHLQVTTADIELRYAVKDFLHTRLLYWLEALSLVKNVKMASQALMQIRNWSVVSLLPRLSARKLMH